MLATKGVHAIPEQHTIHTASQVNGTSVHHRYNFIVFGILFRCAPSKQRMNQRMPEAFNARTRDDIYSLGAHRFRFIICCISGQLQCRAFEMWCRFAARTKPNAFVSQWMGIKYRRCEHWFMVSLSHRIRVPLDDFYALTKVEWVFVSRPKQSGDSIEHEK